MNPIPAAILTFLLVAFAIQVVNQLAGTSVDPWSVAGFVTSGFVLGDAFAQVRQ